MTLPSKRKSARLEIDAPHTKRLTSPVAAAASTILYSLQYGDGGGYGDDLADSIESPSGKADCDEDDDYILDGLIFSDDEDFIRYFQRTPQQRMATCLLLHLVSCLGTRTQRTGLPFGILS